MKTKNKYRVEVYHGGEQFNVTVETNSLEHAKKIAQMGEFSIIIDLQTQEVFEP